MADRRDRRRWLRLSVVAVLAAALLAVGSAIPAAAETSADSSTPEVKGGLDSTGLHVAARIAHHTSPDTSAPPPPYTWRFIEWPYGGGGYCEEGQIHYQAWRIDNATGWRLRFYRLTSDGSGRDPEFEENSPINPTVYDTALEVWFTHVCYGPPLADVEAALERALPDPKIGLNPRAGFGGITGMATWIWYQQDVQFGPDPEVELAFPVTDPENGVTYIVSASAWATHFRWSTGDGAIYEATTPGTESAEGAGASHLYESTGVYGMDTTVRWVGQYAYTGYTGIEGVGPVELSGSTSYPVREVRSLPVNPG